MTLDVKIGKRMVQHENGEDVEYVKMCAPVHFDVCNPEHTLWEREAYRSGSTGFWDFWMKPYMKDMYLTMRKHPRSNDIDIAPLLPFLKDIKKLPSSQFQNGVKVIDDLDFDRLEWFKFWALRAVNLYGKEAYISFS